MEDEEHDSVPRGGPSSVATPNRVSAITVSQWRRLRGRVLLCVALGVALAVASCSLSGSSQPTGTAPIGHPGSPKPIAAMSGTAVPSGSETASSSPIAETPAPSASPSSSSSATLRATLSPTPLLTPRPLAGVSLRHRKPQSRPLRRSRPRRRPPRRPRRRSLHWSMSRSPRAPPGTSEVDGTVLRRSGLGEHHIVGGDTPAAPLDDVTDHVRGVSCRCRAEQLTLLVGSHLLPLGHAGE